MKLILGQLEQVQALSKKTIKIGFRVEGGKLKKYTISGRKRRNWISSYRKLSRKYLKQNCENRRCSTIHNLTIHHKIPLSSAKSEEELRDLCKEYNCQTLCKKCHEELEHRITLKRNGKAKKKKKFKKKIARKLRKKVRKVLKVNLVKKVKLEKLSLLSSESILWLEQDEWGSYRIIDG